MNSENSETEGISTINPTLFSAEHALPVKSSDVTEAVINHRLEASKARTLGYVTAGEFLPFIQEQTAANSDYFDEDDHITEKGLSFCDWHFYELLARSGNLALANSTLREANFMASIHQVELSNRARQVLEVLDAKFNYAVHMYYAIRRYHELNVPDLYQYLQDRALNDGDRIPSRDEMIGIANTVLEQDVAEYTEMIRNETERLQKSNQQIYEQDGARSSGGLKEAAKRVADFFAGSKRRLATTAVTAIAVGVLAFGVSKYRDDLSNVSIPSLNVKPAVTTPGTLSNVGGAIASITGSRQGSLVEVPTEIHGIHKSLEDAISNKPETKPVVVTMPEAITDYQKRFDELIDSGCYSLHRNVTREGEIVNVLTVNPDTKNTKVCEWNVSWMRSSVPTGETYPTERAKSRRSQSSSTIAYYSVEEGEEAGYPIQLGPTCYIDSFSIASNLLRAKIGVPLEDNVVIDPAFLADIFEVPYDQYVEENKNNGDTPLDIFNLIAQRDDADGVKFETILNDLLGLEVEAVPLPKPGPDVNSLVWLPEDAKELVEIPKEIDPYDENAYVDYLKEVVDKIYPEDGETDAVLRLSLDVDPSTAHALVVAGVNRTKVRDDDGEYTGDIGYDLVLLEGNGGGIAEADYLKKNGVSKDDTGAVHLALTPESVLLFRGIDVVRLTKDNAQNSFAYNNLNYRLMQLGLTSPDSALN